MIGKTIAHYEVIEKIGAGGMGEVYRARDQKLGRDVALKLLPESFAFDAERLSRFDREAKLLAALNHAHIAAIYGSEQFEGRQLLVLELVEGEDLAKRLAKGPLPIDDALSAALQICEALEAAHDQGVIHRDLKPANIQIAPDGAVKVLDFGLAKALDSDDADGNLSHSPTLLASSPTMQGTILGTAAYMSPEQARGKTVDRRADIFAFGCVLFEMLTARQCFSGETVSDTLASVLKEAPDWDALPNDLPQAIDKLLKRCLDKNPRLRLRDIGEARIVIDRVIRGEVEPETATAAQTATQPRRTGERVVWAAGALLVGIVAFFSAQSMQPASPEPPLRKFRLPIETEGARPEHPIISPDGTHLTYVLGNQLVIQSFAELDPLRIDTPGPPRLPFWSPDGTQIGYIAENRIWKVPVTGGASTMVCDPHPTFTGGSGGTWTEDGRIIFGTGETGLLEVSAQGGDESVFLELGEEDQDLHEPWVLPGDRGVLFLPHRTSTQPDRIELFADGKRRVLLEVKGMRLHRPRYSPTGHILYRRPGANGGIWALPFSLASLEVTGKPFIVSATGNNASPSDDGTLVFIEGAADGNYVMRWLSRDGTLSEPMSEPNLGQGWQSFAPDGQHVVLGEISGENTDLWIYDLVRGSRTRFTFDPGPDIFPVWAPDGREIYYWRTGPDSIYRKPADGTGTPVAVIMGRAPTLSPDQEYLAYYLSSPTNRDDVYYVALDDLEPTPLVATAADEDNPLISPAGGYIAYESNESGEQEIFLTPFPSGEGKWQVSIGGAANFVWGADGRSIHYAARNGDIYEVRVDTRNGVQLSRPKLLFDARAISLPLVPYRYYLQSATDPKKFLIMNPLEYQRDETSTHITIVENWFREFAAPDGE